MIKINFMQKYRTVTGSDRVNKNGLAETESACFLNQISGVQAEPGVMATQPAASSSCHSTQPAACDTTPLNGRPRRRRYDTEFVNKVKQELLTHPVAQLAKKYHVPYSTVSNWEVKRSDARKQVGKRRGFRRLTQQIKMQCVDKVNDLCLQQQNRSEISKKKIISRVAKEEDIHTQTLHSWVVRAKNYSLLSKSAVLLPRRIPGNKCSDKEAKPYRAVSSNSCAPQPKACGITDSDGVSRSSTASPTGLVVITNNAEMQQVFKNCFKLIKDTLIKK